MFRGNKGFNGRKTGQKLAKDRVGIFMKNMLNVDYTLL